MKMEKSFVSIQKYFMENFSKLISIWNLLVQFWLIDFIMCTEC